MAAVTLPFRACFLFSPSPAKTAILAPSQPASRSRGLAARAEHRRDRTGRAHVVPNARLGGYHGVPKFIGIARRARLERA